MSLQPKTWMRKSHERMTTITKPSLRETRTFARNNQNGPFKHQNPNPEKDQIFFFQIIRQIQSNRKIQNLQNLERI